MQIISSNEPVLISLAYEKETSVDMDEQTIVRTGPELTTNPIQVAVEA